MGSVGDQSIASSESLSTLMGEPAGAVDKREGMPNTGFESDELTGFEESVRVARSGSPWVGNAGREEDRPFDVVVLVSSGVVRDESDCKWLEGDVSMRRIDGGR